MASNLLTMKKIFILFACVLTFNTLSAQYKTEVTVTDLHDSNLQGNIQQTLTGLLTEFNNANARDMSLDLSKFNIDAPTKKTIEMLWRNSHFRCEETEVVEPALKLYTGDEYEIRNIPLIFTNLNNEYHEVAITFDLSGKITSFHISLPQNIYADIMRTNNEVTDLRRRQIVLDYVEQFRTAYNTKDIDFMEKVFSDDALIIVGRVIMVQRELMPAIPKIDYLKKSKRQYLNDLRRVFQNNVRIYVDFQDVKVMRHPAKPDWYGVQLKQNYSSDKYSDTGYLFLLWDFTAGDERPQIHVRVWQPDKIKGKPIDEDEIFSLDDVNIY